MGNTMKLALASDHAGFSLKDVFVRRLREQGHEVLDLGVDTADVPSDYPDAALAIGQAVLEGRAERGILICGSGIGACIADDTYSAHQGVEHDRMNILCLGARIIGVAPAEEIIDAFLKAQPSDEERHKRRFGKMQAIESQHLNHS